MATAALVVALLSLIVAYLAVRRSAALEQRISQLDSSLLNLHSGLNEARDRLDEKMLDLSLEMHKRAGELAFSPSMSIKEAMAVHPRVSEVLASFNLGGCSNCAVSDVDTIEGACQTYGIDQTSLMRALNGLIEPGDGGDRGVAKAPQAKSER